MIQVDHLTKSYGPVTAVSDVSFTVEKGQIVGFLGPNGAGKSTTMKILACFMPASGGTARVAGFDVFSQSMEVRRRIGYLPENAPLYGDLGVGSYLEFVAEIKGVPRGERKGRVADVMARCFITDMQRRLISKLSKGYRQRVGLADALVADPPVLVLDEPQSGLDPVQVRELRAVLAGLSGTRTVLIASHNVGELEALAARIVLVAGGSVIADDTPAALRGQAASLEDAVVARLGAA